MKGAAILPARLLDRFPRGWNVPATLGAVALQVALVGCATWQAPPRVDETALRARAVSATKQDVHLSAAVLSAEDNRRMLGEDVNGTGVQSIWVQVQNRTPRILWLLHSGTDPDYFSPQEVAWAFHAPLARAYNAAIDEHFDSLSFKNPIPSGATRAGILFTNPQNQTRLLNVDLLGRRKLIPFTLLVPVPGTSDGKAHEIMARYADTQIAEFHNSDAFRAELERLPCCATGPKGAAGDPINVVLVGQFVDVAPAVVRRGFRSNAKDFDNNQRLFGRPPDVVLRKSSPGGAPANWLRVWLAPIRYRGQPVFLAQTGRPIGGRFAVARGNDLALHPDVDEARNLLIQDLMYSDGLAQLGFVTGVGSAPVAHPRNSLSGTTYYTDGLRAVMFLTARPRTLSDIQILDWVPYLKWREFGTAAENTDAQLH